MRLIPRRLPALAIALALSTFVTLAAATPATPTPETRGTLTPKPAAEPVPLPPASGDAAFDATYADAKVNEKASGYDENLARFFHSEPGFYARLDACQKIAGQERVYGYFDFASGTGYRVVVKPDTPYARCIADAHLGYKLPEPPRRPYVHAFSFTPAPAPTP